MPSMKEKIADNVDLIWERFSVEKRYAILRKFFDAGSAADWSHRDWGRLPREAKKNFGDVARNLLSKYAANESDIKRYAADKTGEIDRYDDEAIASGRHRQELELGMNVRVKHPDAVEGNFDKTWTVVESTSDGNLVRPDNPHGLRVTLYDRAGNEGGKWEPKDVEVVGTYSHDIGVPDKKMDELKGMEMGLEDLMDWKRLINIANVGQIPDDLKARSLKILDEQIDSIREEINRKKRFEDAFRDGFEKGRKTAIDDCESLGKKRDNVREIAEQLSGQDDSDDRVDDTSQSSIGKGIIDNLDGKNHSGYGRGIVDVKEDVKEHIDKDHMPSTFGEGYEVKITNRFANIPYDGKPKPSGKYVSITSDERVSGADWDWSITLREDNLRDIEWYKPDDKPDKSDDEKGQFVLGFIDGYDSYKCVTLDVYEIGREAGIKRAKSDCDTQTKMSMGDRPKIIELSNAEFDGLLAHMKDIKEDNRSDFVDGFFVAYSEFKCPQLACKVGDRAEVDCALQSIEIAMLNRQVPKNFGKGYVAEIKEIDGEQVRLFGESTENMKVTGEWTFVLSRDCLKCPSTRDLTEPEDYPRVKKPKIEKPTFAPAPVSGVKLLKVKCPVCHGKRVIEADNRKICLICGDTF